MTDMIMMGAHKPKWPKCDCDECMASTWVIVEGNNGDRTNAADWHYAYGPCSVTEALEQAPTLHVKWHVLRFEKTIRGKRGAKLNLI